MAGTLIQKSTTTISTSTSSVTLTGITENCVYVVFGNNVKGSIDNKAVRFRVSNSGTAKTTDYDVAYRRIRASGSFQNISAEGQPYITIGGGAGTGTGEACNFVIYLYNFYDSDQYSFGIFSPVILNSAPELQANTGGFVHDVAESNNEINFVLQDGTFESGTFTLYKQA